MSGSRDIRASDVILIGGGVASATLATMLSHLEPDWKIDVFERLGAVGLESSDPWNNAGTGHSALCELNYTARNRDGSVKTEKDIAINTQFQLSRQFWSYLVRGNYLSGGSSFINPVPHMSFVRGAADVDFLRHRHAALSRHPLFEGMTFSEDLDEFADMLPLMADGRSRDEVFALTRSEAGTDVDFGELTRQLFEHVERANTTVHLNHEVAQLRPVGDRWGVKVRDLSTDEVSVTHAPFVFVGAGGGALQLLQGAGLPEAKGFGGFPVSGQFLRCDVPEIVEQHGAKVYGKAASGAPPMSVPHLDTRVVGGKRTLLFGPYAGFSPKFLKSGSVLDLPRSVRPDNIVPMLAVAKDNLDLMKYLVGEIAQTSKGRVEALRDFVPNARAEDWKLFSAGQRVQVIAKDPEKHGVLQFGTELITSSDRRVGALLGASPGASTATSIMLTLLERQFPEKLDAWGDKLREMVPSYGRDLANDPDLVRQVIGDTSRTLGLVDPYAMPEAQRSASPVV